MTKISEEERKRRKNLARNLLYASDPDYAKRGREKSAIYRLAHPDKAKQCKAAHYVKNKAVVNAKRNAAYARNPEPYKAYSIQYAKDNKLQVSQKNKIYRELNVDRIKVKKAVAYLKNREKISRLRSEKHAQNPLPGRARVKAWAAQNPEKVRVHHINRRAMKSQGAGRLSADIAQKLLNMQKGKCPCCKADLKNTGYHLDHIEPLSKGGPHEDSNIQLLCPACNMSKHTANSIDFMQSRGFLL